MAEGWVRRWVPAALVALSGCGLWAGPTLEARELPAAEVVRTQVHDDLMTRPLRARLEERFGATIVGVETGLEAAVVQVSDADGALAVCRFVAPDYPQVRIAVKGRLVAATHPQHRECQRVS